MTRLTWEETVALALYQRIIETESSNKRITERAYEIKNKYNLSDDEFERLCKECYDKLTSISM